ncbi:neuroligin-4, X-linked-like [Gigantopelta aegis]|uniref:neuroligin-4, X-linked-like n=1 Tax=Gigantopelta aegis TaxID=1735272 RepID=UPI001B88DFE0|nr:neuroligin-4, X-linked-like [Gigantopelta aegis]
MKATSDRKMIPCSVVSLVVCVALTGTIVTCDPQEFTVRETVYGKIRGYVHSVLENSTVERFLGIPYAAPPTGHLRFENPREPPTWTDILNTTVLSPACPQSHWGYLRWHVPDFDSHSEDCLYMNIYVPKTGVNNAGGMAVLVHVHGGSNLIGMAAMFHGDVLAVMGNIIVVTFNYRLGPFGFLSGGNADFPGNYGLLDQSFALHWVQENIHFFGGDPSKVTLQGHSAGSSDVVLHLFSSESKGLFRHAVMLSGVATAYWAFSRPPHDPAFVLREVASEHDCSSHDTTRTKQCLKNVPWENMLDVSESFRLVSHYLPVVDNVFLNNTPENLIEDSPINGVAYMMGIARNEGIRMVRKPDHYRLTPASIKGRIPDQVKPENFPQFIDLIHHEYSPWSDPDNSTANIISLANIVGDLAIVAPVVDVASRIAKRNKVMYFYSFEYQSPLSSLAGVPHGLDLFYLFGCPFSGHPRFNYSNEDREVSRVFIELWSNFVKNGKPSSLSLSSHVADAIPRFSSDSQHYMKLSGYQGNASVVVASRPWARQVHFWNSLWSELRNSGSSTYQTGPGAVAWVFIATTGFLFVVIIALIGCLVYITHRRTGSQFGRVTG